MADDGNRPVTSYGYGAEPGVLAIAHRGGAALGPENTLDAFERALALGYRYLETDARVTSDGVCVAFHDRTLLRLAGRRGRLADLTCEDVRRLRVHGTGTVPRLEDLLGAWPEVRWVVDIKQPSALTALVRAVRRSGAANRVCLSGTWDRWLDDARRELGPPLSTALGWRSMAQLLAGRTPDRQTSDFVHLPLRLGTRRVPSVRLVQRAHDHGLRVVVWGVENARETHRLLDDGVDGVITNHTDLIREALLARGSWHVPTPARAR